MKVKFRLYRDVNHTNHECNLVDFTLRLPDLLSKKNKLIPPTEVLSETFKKGLLFAETVGLFEWNGFSPEESELNDLTRRLKRKGYIAVDPPEWVTNRDAWVIWKFEYLNHIPSKKHLSLYNQLYVVEQAMQTACDDNQTAVLNKLSQEKIQIMSKLSDYALHHFVS
ncbi:hypothetical protein [Marinicella sp. W31]|uniref:hypothetical protein n=1 Tax=Marinicella sp. W31 TaxID=3023713 RepID=UPI0037580AE4